MKKTFTKIYYFAVLILLSLGASLRTSGQTYTASKLATNAWATAVCKDAAGNIYAVESANKTGVSDYGKVVKYTNGTGSGTTIYTGNNSTLPFNDCDGSAQTALGIAVTSNGDVYVTTNYDYGATNCAATYGAIIKLTAASSYSESTFLAGTVTFGGFTALAVDASDNLYTLVYDQTGDGGAGSYEVEEFPATGGVPVAGNKFRINNSDACQLYVKALNNYSAPENETALTVDPSGNIYVADAFDGGSNSITGTTYKLTKGSGNSYTKSTFLNLNVMGLGSDAAGNIYATYNTGTNATTLIEYVGGSTSNTQTLATGLAYTDEFELNSIAVVNSTDVYINDGEPSSSDNDGIEQFFGAPTTQGSNVAFSNTTATSTAVSWTNGSGTSRAVFIEQGSTGTPTLNNTTTYNAASSVYTTGSTAGSGWYCVYNGTGTSANITGLSPGTGYRVMVVEYNGGTGAQNYDTNTGTNNPNNVTTATPTISAPGGTTTLTSTISGTPGSSTSFNISGSNLLANVTVTAPSNVQVSSDNSSWGSTATITESGGSISNVPVYVRLAGTGSVGTISGNVALSSTSATTVNQAVSGSLNSPSTTISSLTAVTSTTTNATSVQYTATFAASISGLSTSDFTLNTSGVSGASVTGVSGSGTTYTVTVNTGSGDGTLQLSMNSASGVSPSVSNLPFNGTTYTIDKTAPNVSIGSPSVASIITGTGSVSYTVTYADANFNSSSLTTGNITLNSTGTASGTVAVSGSGTSYTVTISGITGTGTLGISIGAGTASDLAGNTASASGASTTFNVVYSTDATLSNMVYSKGVLNPVFAPATTSYVNYIPNITTSLTVTPTTNDPNATVTVNGTAVSSGTASAAIPLAVGTNTITTTVTAQDGSTTKSYTVSVIRSPSDNDILSSLTLTPTTAITVVAGPDYKDYTGTVKNSVTSIQVTPTSSVATSTITVNGATVASGTASGPIALSLGQNTITTVVTAQDGSSTKTYVITLTRPYSDNANLSAIRLNPSKALTLVAGPDYKDYTASVNNATSTIQVIPTTADNTATVTVNGATVASGTSSAPIALAVGSNTITTVVTAQNGVTTHTYGITVTRAAPSMNNVYEQVSVSNPTDHPQMMGEEINVHQGLSPNGDGINDFLLIDGISSYPDNKLQIMTRGGQLVFEAKGYDNSTKVFDGHSNKNGSMQLPGTYFYTLDYAVNGVAKHKTGFIVLKY